MARKDVLEIYKSFNAEQKQFVSSKRIEADFKLKRWLELLENVAIMDGYADEAIKKLSSWKLKFLGLGIGVTFITFFLMGLTSYFAVLFIVAFILFGLSVINYLRQKRFKKFDLSNSLRLFTIPLMKVLREETDKENPVRMKLDFNNPINKEYLVKIIKNTNTSYPHVDTSIYKNQWMNGQITLVDDVEINWNITDMAVKKDIKKRNSRGKYKFKTKVKVKHLLRLTIAFPKVNFNLTKTPTDFPYMDKDEFHVFKLKGKTYSDNMDTSLDMNYFLDAIATSFSYIQPINE